MAAKTVASDYDGRIRRAERLASLYPFAQEILNFYTCIAEFQKSSYLGISNRDKRASAKAVFTRDQLDIVGLVPHFKKFLAAIAEHAPTPLAESAHAVSSEPPGLISSRLARYWSGDNNADFSNAAFEQFLPRAFLQPYAEYLSGDGAPGEMTVAPALCPLCDARPLLGILRPEGDGGKRFLLCSFCLREWEFRRIICSTCGEETETKLPVFVAEQFPYIRVEACDTCKFYLRTIDLTKDGNAVPLVDDLAALPLSLWAHEHGYLRAQPNLLGT
jgi:formate dehydrogenase accessory protein FdhE